LIFQAAGLALLAALSPTALLIAAVYLGSARPRLTGLLYLAGAVIMTVIMAIVVLVVLHSVGLNQPREHEPRYGLRLGLGVIAFVAGLVVAARKPKPPDPDKPMQGFMSKLVANPAPAMAFVVGILVFTPGVTFVAAMQVIATAQASIEAIVTAALLVVIINVMLVWGPIVLYLLAPDVTSRRLTAFNLWLRTHGHLLLTGGLLAAGTILIVNGALGLAAR
jgi:Sap-like sulfolipid-1-addressing protein